MPMTRHHPKVVHNGLHFNLHISYDSKTRQTTHNWVWEKEQVVVSDWHVHIPKAKSTGEKFPMVPPPRAPVSAEPFHPEAGPHLESRVSAPKWTPEIGARYCHQLHAIVPENLDYKVEKLASARTPLRERLFTPACPSSTGIDIKVVPAEDGTTVLAEGLTHHQAALIPLRDAQNDLSIKYRSLTAKRTDLVERAAAQQVPAIKYRTALPVDTRRFGVVLPADTRIAL